MGLILMTSTDSPEIVDDRDPRVQLLPLDSWVLSGVPEEYKGTTTGTITGGSRVRFTFTGYSVAVYGSISKNMSRPVPFSTYSIDGSVAENFSVAEVPQEALYRHQFYQSPTLEDREHVLVVTSMVQESEFWLDYFQLLHTISPPSTNTLVSSIASSSTTPIILPPSSSLMPTINTSISPIGTSGQSPIKSAPINKGLIAGATIGGVVIIALIATIIWVIFRRKARRSSSLDANSVQPFVHSNREWTPSLSVSEQNPTSTSSYLGPDRRLQYTMGSTEKAPYRPQRALDGLGPQRTDQPAIQSIRDHTANLTPPHTMDSWSIVPPPAYNHSR